MNDSNIKISAIAVEQLKRKITIAIEEIGLQTREIENSLITAETEGWSDKYFHDFDSLTSDIVASLKSNQRRLEDKALPFLTKMQDLISQF